MDDKIKKICDNTIKNYRFATQKLRYDGDYINHFCALIKGYKNKNIDYEKIKQIRSLIKEKTLNMSPFRGDILYILSFLLVDSNETEESFIDELLQTFDMLVKERFIECGYLVLAAYSITKYVEKNKRQIVAKRMKSIFYIMQEKYGSCTKQDDYLLSALLSIEDIQCDNIAQYMQKVSDYMKKYDLLNNNSIQSITNSIVLRDNDNSMEKIVDFLLKSDKSELKIGPQFIGLVGIFIKNQDNNKILQNMKEVLSYLSDEEPEYYYYMDKDFRNMIALVIILMSDKKDDAKYIDELIAFGVYSFIMSKNQGILNEVIS